MRRKSFVVAVLVTTVSSVVCLSGQEKSKTGDTRASVPDLIWKIEPTKLKDATWSVTTDPSKPNVVKVVLDFRQLSILQGVYNVQCTVKLTDQRTHATKTETFSIIDVLEGGKIYVKEFRTHITAADWRSVQVEGEKLEGNLRSHIYASQPPEKGPTT
jgi:hypothetical protein